MSNLHLTPHFLAAYSIFRVLGQVLIFILEDEDGFVVEEVAKRTFRARISVVLKPQQALEVVERASLDGHDVSFYILMNRITCF